MKTIILKFGGAAFASPDCFEKVASLIIAKKTEYDRVAVVVSAMGGVTHQLDTLAQQVNTQPPQREYDMLLSVGERISGSLLAMALHAKGQEAISFTGSQAGIITCERHGEARIIDVKPHRILEHLNDGKIVIVAGFQGVSHDKKNITTLGKNGSDITAVALAVAFGASVEFYKDVSGIFLEDPKKNSRTSLLKTLSYDQALEIVSNGAQVLHERSLLLAKKNVIKLLVRSFDSESGTVVEGEPDQDLVLEPFYEEIGG